MADKEERSSGKAKVSLPAGAVNFHKAMAAGMSKDAAEEKATTKTQAEQKPR